MPRPRVHTAVTLCVATLFVLRTRRWRDAIPVLVAGILVDIDHLTDLLVNRRGERLVWTILPLHAWEWVFALLTRNGRRTDGLAGGLAVHLALDQLNHAITHPLFYWITFRALHRFRAAPPLVDAQRYSRGSAWMREKPHEWF